MKKSGLTALMLLLSVLILFSSCGRPAGAAASPVSHTDAGITEEPVTTPEPESTTPEPEDIPSPAAEAVPANEPPAEKPVKYDCLIAGASVIDGTGAPAYIADVGIKDGKIAAIGDLSGAEASSKIKADGLTLSPGFIDSHTHADKGIISSPQMKNALLDGVTTLVSGQCGGSYAPSSSAHGASVKEYFDYLDNTAGIACNLSMLVGHGNLRSKCVKKLTAPATDAEIEKMKVLLRTAMDQGALGLSFGLEYSPGMYADTHELIELAKVVAEYDGLVTVHYRSQSESAIDPLEEMIRVTKESGVRMVISHLKGGSCGKAGQGEKRIGMIQEAKDAGMRIWSDVYPYTAFQTSLLSQLFSNDLRALGNAKIKEYLSTEKGREEAKQYIIDRYLYNDWEGKELSWVYFAGLGKYSEYNGLSVEEAAKKHGKDQFSTLFDVLLANNLSGNGIFFAMSDKDVETIISAPFVMIGSDGGASFGTHPRYASTFTRTLALYVREKQCDTLVNMIHRMTGLPASVYGFESKGTIEVGKDADLCLFDAATVKDGATFQDTKTPNTGIKYVFVNGVAAVKNGKVTGDRAGGVLRTSYPKS